MKVSTTFVGATDTHGERVVAKVNGKQHTAPYDYGVSALENHSRAAAHLLQRVFPNIAPESVTAVEDTDKGYRWTLGL